MSFPVLHSGRRRAQAAWVLLLCVTGILHAADPAPTAELPSTNSAPEKTFLQNIGTHIFSTKPVVPTTPLDSLQARPAPMRPPWTIQNPKEREPSDAPHSWKNASPDDLMEKYLAQEIFQLKEYGSDREQTGKDAIKSRFFRELFVRSIATNRPTANDPSRLEDEEKNRFLTGRGGARTSTDEVERVKELMTVGVDTRQPEGILDVLQSFHESPGAIRARREREEQIDEFKKILNYNASAPLPPNGVLKTPAEMAIEAEKRAPGSGFYSSSISQPLPPPPSAYHTFKPPGFSSLPAAPTAPSAPALPSLTPVLSDPAPKRIKPQPLNVTPGRRKL